jgi:NADH-quinone oxidoreductase subunit J
LLTRDSGTTSQSIISSSWKASGVVVLGVFGVLAWSIGHSAVSQRATSLPHDTSMQEIGNVLMQQFALPLEVVGVLLTVALIGAVTIAIYEKKETR